MSSTDTHDHSMEEMAVVADEAPMAEQLPSVVKSHLPPHLQPRVKKPLEASIATNNGSTPAIVKRRQASKWFNSPTDTFLSPCTQKLMKPKHDSQAIAPLNLDLENDDLKQVSTEVDQS